MTLIRLGVGCNFLECDNANSSVLRVTGQHTEVCGTEGALPHAHRPAIGYVYESQEVEQTLHPSGRGAVITTYGGSADLRSLLLRPQLPRSSYYSTYGGSADLRSLSLLPLPRSSYYSTYGGSADLRSLSLRQPLPRNYSTYGSSADLSTATPLHTAKI